MQRAFIALGGCIAWHGVLMCGLSILTPRLGAWRLVAMVGLACNVDFLGFWLDEWAFITRGSR